MYRVRVERDSVSPGGRSRLTSFVIQFPRIVLAEFVTHRLNSDTWGEDCFFCERTTTRDISKNSASSRAIPLARMIENVRKDPYMPSWTLDQKGMQGRPLDLASAVDNTTRLCADGIWLEARRDMIRHAERLGAIGVHKQDANRLLEPWMWITQIVTSSRWDNFFALRCHSAAHPAFRHVARMMYLAFRASTPTALDHNQWHLPFVPLDQQKEFTWTPQREWYGGVIPDLIKFSAARCAWISYENHDRDGTPDAMLKTWDRLFQDEIKHASPVEHQATPMNEKWMYSQDSVTRELYHLESNLTGWLQARKLLKDEEVTKFNPSEEDVSSWGIDETKLWTD